jgi:hypothetical protein
MRKLSAHLNFGKDHYHSVQNLWSSCVLYTNIKTKIYKTINLPGVLYGCETWLQELR